MTEGARTDSFEEETRRLLQRRLGLTFSVLAGVSLFYVLSDFVQMLVPDAERQSTKLVTLLTLTVAVGCPRGSSRHGFASKHSRLPQASRIGCFRAGS